VGTGDGSRRLGAASSPRAGTEESVHDYVLRLGDEPRCRAVARSREQRGNPCAMPIVAPPVRVVGVLDERQSFDGSMLLIDAGIDNADHNIARAGGKLGVPADELRTIAALRVAAIAF